MYLKWLRKQENNRYDAKLPFCTSIRSQVFVYFFKNAKVKFDSNVLYGLWNVDNKIFNFKNPSQNVVKWK